MKEITLRAECLIDLYQLIEQNQTTLFNKPFLSALKEKNSAKKIDLQ